MPKVSYNKLNQHIVDKLFNLLPEMISACSTPKKADIFVDALFSSSEKTMIAKRIAVMLMLAKGKTYNQISDKLKVSQSTIGKMAETIAESNPAFLDQFRRVAKSDAASDFWNELGYKIETLIPPKGRNWSTWRSRKIREKLENEQPF